MRFKIAVGLEWLYFGVRFAFGAGFKAFFDKTLLQALYGLYMDVQDAGDLIVGTGGCRKVRLAGKGRGKSGGYRLVTYFAHADGRVLLLTVFSKADQASLSKAFRNELAALTRRLGRAKS